MTGEGRWTDAVPPADPVPSRTFSNEIGRPWVSRAACQGGGARWVVRAAASAHGVPVVEPTDETGVILTSRCKNNTGCWFVVADIAVVVSIAP